jgi:glycogen operon protein
VIWRRPDGEVPRPEDWHDPAFRCLGVEIRLAAEEDGADRRAVFVVFNGGAARDVVLPRNSTGWQMILDTSRPDAPPAPAKAAVAIAGDSVVVFEAMSPSGGLK